MLTVNQSVVLYDAYHSITDHGRTTTDGPFFGMCGVHGQTPGKLEIYIGVNNTPN